MRDPSEPEPVLPSVSASSIDNASLASRYSIERELGRGGMATVHLARDLRHERLVALKIMHPELAVTLGRERFLREIRVAAGFAHPHIVPLHDSGIADGVLFYVMPFVEGESLRARLAREGPLPIADTVALSRQIADALAYAHGRGVVHRDLKPDNVLIDGSGHALVTDFGVALAAHLAGDERLTRTGVSLGTPAYMSPEQLAGDMVDARSDVWAIGCVMYEMLTGKLPPRVHTAVGTERGIDSELRRVRAEVPDALAVVVQRALSADPADRFANGRALLDALGSGTSIVPVRPRQNVRRGVLTAAALTGLLVLAALATQDLWMREVDPEVRALYERGMRSYAVRTPEASLDALQSFSAAIARDTTWAPAWVGLANTYVQAAQRRYIVPGVAQDSLVRLAVIAVDRAMALDSGDARTWNARAQASRLVDVRDRAESQRAARRAIALDSSLALAWHTLAQNLAETGALDSAISAWRESVRRTPSYNEGAAFLALGHMWNRRLDSASIWADSAVSLDGAYVNARMSAGQVATARGEFDRAIRHFEAARRLSTGVELVHALAGRAIAEARAGRTSAARATIATADSLATGYQPAAHHTAVYLAQAHFALGQRERAYSWLRRYADPADLHFQLHLRCDPAFDVAAGDAVLESLLAGSCRR